MNNLTVKNREENLKVAEELNKVLLEKEFSWTSFSAEEKSLKFKIWYENLKDYPSEVIIKSLKNYLLEVEKRKHDIAIFFQDFLLPNFQSWKYSNKNKEIMTLLEKPAITEEEFEDFNKKIADIFAEKSV